MWGTLIRVAALAAVLLVAGCGGGSSSGDGDMAALVPADSLLYAEAVVRPEGDQRENALDAAGKVLRTDDPEAKIAELWQASGIEDIDYERDLKPWLGERIGFWMSPRSLEDESAVVIFEATDTEQALETIRGSLGARGRGRHGRHPR